MVMEKEEKEIYSQQVLEFVAIADQFCKYCEKSGEIPGKELAGVFQKLLPLLYFKALGLPSLEPVFEEGNEKVVTEADWSKVKRAVAYRLGKSDYFQEPFDERLSDSEEPGLASHSEYIADIYQELKDCVILYRTGTEEVMNDALWECRTAFDTHWGQKAVNSLRGLHRLIISGDEISPEEVDPSEVNKKPDMSDWFLSKMQDEYGREND